MTDIWYRSPDVLFHRDTYLSIVPLSDMTDRAKMNALMRLSIYMSVILLLLTNDIRWLYLPVAMACFTVATNEYYIYTETAHKERFLAQKVAKKGDGSLCRRPTPENPMMNVLMNEYVEDPERPPACPLSHPVVQDAVKTYIDKNIYRDADDLFHKKASDWHFYSMPNTTIPNNQNEFATWLYGSEKTCKEGSGEQCFANTAMRVNLK
jgi:hypothetical protein